MVSKKKDIYVNESNKRLYYTIIDECKRLGISPSDFMIKTSYEKLTSAGGLEAAGNYTPIKQDTDLLKDLIRLANNMQNNGIDGLNLSYILPYRYERGYITLPDIVNLYNLAFRINVILMQVPAIRDAFLMSDLKRNSIRYIESDEFGQFRGEFLTNLQYTTKKEQEKKEFYEKIQRENKIKEQWTREHPGIPYHLRDVRPEDLDFFLKVENGEWVEILE